MSVRPARSGDGAGAFNSPEGIGVDNSTGPAAGSVYVVDTNNNRIQRFTADGHFVLMWGKAVDQQSAANICDPAATGHTCQAGLQSKTSPTEDGVFSGWDHQDLQGGIDLAMDAQGHVYVTDAWNGNGDAVARIQKFDSGGNYLSKVYTPTSLHNTINGTVSPTVGPNGDAYVVSHAFGQNGDGAFVAQFDASAFDPVGATAFRRSYGASRDVTRVVVDPTNGYLIGLSNDCDTTPNLPGVHIIEYQPTTEQEVDCTIPSSPGVDLAGGLAMSASSHKLYVTHASAGNVQVFQPPSTQSPVVTGESASEVTARSARINADIVGNLDETTFHVDYGTAGPCSSNPCASTQEFPSIGAALTPRQGSGLINDLEPNTQYYFRVVATNGKGSDDGEDGIFRTFALSTFAPCPNNLARQQTGAAFLLDCRAYELVSAENQGGYNVESDLVPGQVPYGGYPGARDKALYAVHNGGVPNTGKPTNRGPDPYVAVRDAANQRWDTSYVGVPADVGSNAPFSSTLGGADAGLSAFAFSGPEICDPCFPGGASGIPLRMPDGTLIQGMKGTDGGRRPDTRGRGEETAFRRRQPLRLRLHPAVHLGGQQQRHRRDDL